MSTICFSLIPAFYHSIQLFKEKTGILKGGIKVKGDFSSELTDRVQSVFENYFHKPRVSVYLDSNFSDELGCGCYVVKKGRNFEIVASSLLSIDDDMLMFCVQHEISHILSNDSVLYHQANLIQSIVSGLLVGYFFPIYAAVPLVGLLNYAYGTVVSKRHELRADQSALGRCTEKQIRGGWRFFKLQNAIYRVMNMQQNLSFENLQKLIDQGVEPPESASHPLNSLRIKWIGCELIRRSGHVAKIEDEELIRMIGIGMELFKAARLSENSGDPWSEEEQQAATSLGTFIAYDLIGSSEEPESHPR